MKGGLLPDPIPQTEKKKMELDMEQSKHDEIQANISKLMAETMLINKKTRWFEILMAVAITAVLVKFF